MYFQCFMKGLRNFLISNLYILCALFTTSVVKAEDGALSGHRHRVVVSTDIGGTDPDDFQSMVHLMVYADCFDLEGLISSPYGEGGKRHILNVIDAYAVDYPNLKSHSDKFPLPEELRAICKQGAIETPGESGIANRTEGSDWIIECARRNDSRPLHVLVWGGIEDLARALHDAPDILSKLRVYWIGGPNKKWSPSAYNYIERHHPNLWMIEANSTYRGWFTGGNQEGEWGNVAFVSRHIAGHGALGAFFVDAKLDIKMGDTPSVSRLLVGNSEDPSQPGWGGQYVRAWERPRMTFNRLTTVEDQIEQFCVFNLILPIGNNAPSNPEVFMQIENQTLPGYRVDEGHLLFRFSPKAAKTYSYKLSGNVPALDGMTGALTSFLTPTEFAQTPSSRLPNWWTDDPSSCLSEGPHQGAKSVSRWREDFLQDFANRMDWCLSNPETVK